jgi:DNA (cytosine-5)-methyltransferase 1
MLDASELWRAQGFGDPNVEGITKTDQVKLCGNSVSPPVAEALVRANVANTNAQRGAA